MISKKRLKLSVNHKESDRVPTDLGGFNDSSIAAIAYNNLRKELGIHNSLARMYDFIMQLLYIQKRKYWIYLT